MQVALALGLVAACGQRSFTDADAQGVRAVIDAQRDAWNEGDLDAFMAGYHDDPNIVFTSSGKIRRGWQEARDSYQRRYVDGDAAMGTLDFTDVEITGLGPDAALAMGHFVLTNTPRAGRGVFSLIFTRREGKWAILHDHSSGQAEAEAPTQNDRPPSEAGRSSSDDPTSQSGGS